MAPAALGDPTASKRGAKSKVAQKWAVWLHNPCHRGGPHRFGARGKSEVADKRAGWLHNSCRLRGPHRSRVGGRITGGPPLGRVAT